MDKVMKRQFVNWIASGYHTLIIQDAKCVTIQPLTLRGYEAICRMVPDAPKEILQGLAKKKQGHYTAAIPLDYEPEQIVRSLVLEQGLPDGSAVVFKEDVELPQLILGDQVH